MWNARQLNAVSIFNTFPFSQIKAMNFGQARGNRDVNFYKALSFAMGSSFEEK